VHTFRNAGDEEARVISVVSPAGLERYYQALAELPEGPPDINAIKEIMADFGLQLRIPPQAG
jgi:DNA-binding phage protein